MSTENKRRKALKSLPAQLLIGIVLGILTGLVLPEGAMTVVVTVKYILAQLINFCVPLIIIGFIAPSITQMGSSATKLLIVAVAAAYLSSVLAAFMSMGAGYALIPHLNIAAGSGDLRELPDVAFQLDIPQIMPVMSALVLSILLGLAAVWTKAKTITSVLQEFQEIVLKIVRRIIIPVLPVFIAVTFCALSWQGTITRELPVFLIVVLIVIIGHYIWLAVLYGAASVYSRRSGFEVLKHYWPAYITAIGTMSSAATLAVALGCARKSKNLRRDLVDFGVPLFANIHLCGSVLTEVFFVMTISCIMYGQIPAPGRMILFCFLLGIFAIGAPGVPGGTVVASLGLITGILGFSSDGTALMLAVFALQDSFGTACNVTGDGALTLFLTGYAEKHGIKEESPDSSSPDEVQS